MAKRKHLINVHTSTGTTAPTGASLNLGEIAVQHTSNDPALWIKKGNNESSTEYEKFIGETQINTLISNSNILGSGYTYSGIPYVNSSTTIADAYSALTKEVLDDERVWAEALNDLNEQIDSVSAKTDNRINTMYEVFDNRIDDVEGDVTGVNNSLSALSSATYTHVTNDTIHVTAGDKQNWNNKQNAISDLVEIRKNAASGMSAYTGYIAHSADTDIHVTAQDKTKWTNGANSGASAWTAVTALSAATTALTGTVNTLSSATIALVGASAASVYASAVSYVNSTITTLDSSTAVTAGKYITGIAIKDGKISGITQANLPSESQLSTATTGAGNVVSNLTVDGHQITIVKNITAATSAQVSSLSSATMAHINSAASHVSASDRTNWNAKQDAINNLDAIINGANSGASAYTIVTELTGTVNTLSSATHNKITALSAATTAHTSNGDIHVTANQKNTWTTQGGRADTALQSVCGGTYIAATAKAGSNGAWSQTINAVTGSVADGTNGLAIANEVKDYIDSTLSSAVEYKGATSGTPTSAENGDLYIANSAWTIGSGSSAKKVEVGDFIIYNGSSWDVIQKNLDGAITGSLTAKTVTLGNGVNEIKSLANGTAGTVLASNGTNADPSWTSAVKVNSASTADNASNATKLANSAATTFAHTDGTYPSMTVGNATNAANATNAGNANTVNNLTVETAVPANAVFTDTATTKEGHYVPSSTDSTEGSTTGFIQQIKLDSKKHVVGIVSGTTSYTETSVTTGAGTSSSNASAVLVGITPAGTKGHQLNLNTTKKIFSAETADSAAALTGSITTGQVTNLAATIKGTKVDNATSADNAAKVNNHTVNTDVPANALFTDSATTETGHYTPSTSALTEGSTSGFIKQIKLDSKKHVVAITSGAAITTETQLSKGTTTGTGNVVTDLSVSNHQITLAKSFSAAPADQFVTLSGATHNKITSLSAATTGINSTLAAHTGNSDIHVTAAQKTNWTNSGTSGANAYVGYIAHSANTGIHVTSTEKSTWNGKQNAISDLATIRTNAASGMAAYNNVNALSAGTLSELGEKADKATTLAGYGITDAKISNGTITLGTSTITPLTAETAVAITNNTATDTATAVVSAIASGGTKGHSLTISKTNKIFSASTADNATKVNNLTVQTAVPANALFTDSATTETGHYTPSKSASTEGSATGFIKQIKLDSKKHVVAIVSGSVSDTATTETGHYSPTTSASTKGTTAATTNFVKGIRIDSKNHVIDVATGTVITAETQLSSAVTGTGNAVTDIAVSGHKITYTKGSTFLTGFTETDPTVPSWAKQTNKPSYTLDEVSDGSTRKLSNYSLTSHTHPEYVNQDAFGKITDGTNTGTAESSADTMTFSGAGIAQVTVSGKKVTVNVPNTNVDNKVLQTVTTSSNTSFRPLILGNSYSDATTFAPATTTSGTYATHLAKYQPSTGRLFITSMGQLSTAGTVVAGADNKVFNTNGGVSTIPAAVTEDTVAGWGFTKNTGTITGINMNGGSKGTSGVVDLGTVITAETQLSSAVTGTGNSVTDIAVSGHKITFTKGSTFLTTAATTTQGSRADSALQAVSGSTYISASTKSGSAGAKVETIYAISGKVADNANALAIASDVKSYVDSLVASNVNYKGATSGVPTTSAKVGDMYIASAKFTAGTQTVEIGDYIIARTSGTSAQWDVIQKNETGVVTSTDTLTANNLVVGNGTQTVKKFANGSAGQVLAMTGTTPSLGWTNAVKVDSASTADSATNATNLAGSAATTFAKNTFAKITDGSTTGTAASTADTITFSGAGIAQVTVSGKKVTVNVPDTNTDTATTETGHYTPTTSAGTKGSATATSFIKQIKVDSKNHVIDVVSGTVVTAQTQLSYNSGASISNNASAVMTGLTVSNHAITYGKTNKIFIASTADLAADSIKLAGSAATSFAKTSGNYTNLTAGTAANATHAGAATKVDSALTINMLTTAGTTGSTITFNGSENKTVNIPANTDTATTLTGHYTPASSTTKSATSGYVVGGLKMDAKGHVTDVVDSAYKLEKNVPSNAVFTDTATTQTGHYTPVTSASTAGDSTKFIRQIKLDDKKHVIDVVSDTVTITDTATTETGHYTPSTTASTKGSSAAASFIKQIKLDSKNHVIDIVSANTSYTETSVTTVAGTTGNTAVPVLAGITTGGTKGHQLTLNMSNKVFSAETSTSAVSATVAADSVKLAGAAASTYTNQNAFGKFAVGSTTGTATAITDTLTFSGAGATSLSVDATNRKLTISSTDSKVTTVGNHYTATTATKTGGTTTSNAEWAVKGITYDAAGHIVSVTSGSVLTAQTSITVTNGTPVNTAAAVVTGITTASTAGHSLTLNRSNKVFSASTADLAADSAKFAGSAASVFAKVTDIPTVDTALDSASTNPVQNKVVTQAIIDNEYVVAQAINDLNTNKLNIADFHDTATTETGHYTPSASASTVGNASGFIKQIKLDSKKHVIEVTTGSAGDYSALSSATYSHVNNGDIHVTATQKTSWTNGANSGASAWTAVTALSAATTAHTANTNIHVTAADKTSWNNAATAAANAITAMTTGGSGNVLVDATYTSSNKTLTLTKGNGVTCESASSGVPVITKIVSITESDYNNLATKDAATLYVVVPDAN